MNAYCNMTAIKLRKLQFPLRFLFLFMHAFNLENSLQMNQIHDPFFAGSKMAKIAMPTGQRCWPVFTAVAKRSPVLLSFGLVPNIMEWFISVLRTIPLSSRRAPRSSMLPSDLKCCVSQNPQRLHLSQVQNFFNLMICILKKYAHCGKNHTSFGF